MSAIGSILDDLKKEIGRQNFNLWFVPSSITLDSNILTLSVPNKFYKDIINESYKNIIIDIWKKYSAEELIFNFSINENLTNMLPFKPEAREQEQVPVKTDSGNSGIGIENSDNFNKNSDNAKTAQKDNGPKKVQKNYPNLNTKYTFESFVVGLGNQFAHAACFAVANLPGHTYNPMFIYSDVGLGKTHLLNAIANKIIKEKNFNTCLVSSERFTNEMIASIRDDKMIKFREKYRNVDVLLIDDIQFIAGKERTQEEFFYTFNALYENQKQIVVSSDKIPRDIISLEERLRSRFEWGLIADIQPPDFETRVAILKKKALSNNIDLNDDIIYFLADKITSNIRELEGALIKIVAFASFTGKKITVDLSKEAISNLLKNEEKVITPELIIKSVCNYFNIKISDIKSNKKFKEYVKPRQIAMYIIRNYTELSFPDIGEKFGGKDHSSVIYAVDKIKKLIKEDPQLEKIIENIIKLIKK